MKWFNNLAKEMQDKLNNNLQQIGEEAGQDLSHLKLKDEVLQVKNSSKQEKYGNENNAIDYNLGHYYDRDGIKLFKKGFVGEDSGAYIQNDYGDIEYKGKTFFQVAGGNTAAKGDYEEGFYKVDDFFEIQIPKYRKLTEERHQKYRETKLNYTGIIAPYDFIKDETWEGLLDFKYEIAGKGKAFNLPISETDPPITRTMYLIGNKYYNVNGAGNFIWGYIGRILHVRYSFIMTFGADIAVRTSAFRNPLGVFTKKGDPIHEQQIIIDGFNYEEK